MWRVCIICTTAKTIMVMSNYAINKMASNLLSLSNHCITLYLNRCIGVLSFFYSLVQLFVMLDTNQIQSNQKFEKKLKIHNIQMHF